MKKLLIFVIPFLIIIGMALIWKSSTYAEIHLSYPVKQSQNPNASSEFLKALEYRVYIKELHPYFDYDNIIMKPLFSLMDNYFQKGKELLSPKSVEDIYWWMIFYKDIYGIGINPDRNDKSLAYGSLPPSEFKEKHDEVYKMIKRYAKGSVSFDTPVVNEYKFTVLDLMTYFFYGQYPKAYQGETPKERSNNFFKSEEALKKTKEILFLYQQYAPTFIVDDNEKEMFEYKKEVVAMSSEVIAFHLKKRKSMYVTSEMCSSNEAKNIASFSSELMNFVKENNGTRKGSRVFKDLFRAKGVATSVVIHSLVKSCDEHAGSFLSFVLYDIYELNGIKQNHLRVYRKGK